MRHYTTSGDRKFMFKPIYNDSIDSYYNSLRLSNDTDHDYIKEQCKIKGEKK